MTSIILVHGIAQEQEAADTLESAWLPALAGGVRNAGHAALADRLWPPAPNGRRLIRMAFYGKTFGVPDQMGPSDGIPDEQQETAEEIAYEWLVNAADSSSRRDAGNAQLELRALEQDMEKAQGIGAVKGRVIAAIDRLPWLSQAGLSGAGRLNKTLGQVVRYLTEPDVRAYAIDQVRQCLDDDTRVVIGHSLGSVVAYEAVRERTSPLPLLITLGSALGLSAVNRRLLQPPSFPSCLDRWINLADRDDFVAARPDLTAVFDTNRPPGARFDSTYTVDNGSSPHKANFYLSKVTTGQAIAEAMADR
ncbi:hypothetical protein ACWGQ4_04410 [Streptomyces sp. NPDC055721]